MISEHKTCLTKSADRPLKLKYLDNYLMNLNKHINKEDSQEHKDLGIVVIIKIHSVITKEFKGRPDMVGIKL